MNKLVMTGLITTILIASSVGISKTAGRTGNPMEGAGSAWGTAAHGDQASLLPGEPETGQHHSGEELEQPSEKENKEAPSAAEEAIQPAPEAHEPEGADVQTEADWGDDQLIEHVNIDNEIEADNEEDIDLESYLEDEGGEGPGTEGDEQEERVAESDNLLRLVQSQIKLGLSVERVVEGWGRDFVEFHNGLDDTLVWRYDLGGTPEHSGTDDPGEVDIDGLQAGLLEAQLYVNWGTLAETVTSYALFYMNNGHVHEYRVFADGQIRKTQITG